MNKYVFLSMSVILCSYIWYYKHTIVYFIISFTNRHEIVTSNILFSTMQYITFIHIEIKILIASHPYHIIFIHLVWELQMDFQDVAFLPFYTTFLKHCGRGEVLGTATCLNTVVGVSNGMLTVKYFCSKFLFFPVLFFENHMTVTTLR